MPSPKQTQGIVAQQEALEHLQKAGLTLFEANANFKVGEIDLVMWDQQTLVFVEVRSRASNVFGGALASVTPAKQLKCRRAAQTFLLKTFGSSRWPACRFDVVALQGKAQAPHGPAQVHWIKGAF